MHPTLGSASLLFSRNVKILLVVFMVLAAFSTCAPLSKGSALTVTVQADNSMYYTGDNIRIYGSVLSDGVPVFNASVALEIRDSVDSPVVTRSIQTNSSGVYSVTFKLPLDAPTGSYTVYVNCAYGGGTGSADTSFQFMKIPFLEITIVSDKTQYYLGENISLSGTVTLNGANLSKVLVAVEVLNPNVEPVIVRVIETDGQGSYVLTFQSSQGSLLGVYTAYASGNHQGSNATAETSFSLKLKQVSADVNGDGKVNIIDLTLVAKAYGSAPGNPRWDPMCDLDGNNIINIIDITLVAREFRFG